MIEIITKNKLDTFKNNLSKCVNTKHKTYKNNDLILTSSPIKKKIGFIVKGKANIIKTDKFGNTSIIRDLKENDIFSNLFFQNSEDDIYIISKNDTEVIFIDYYNIIKNCQNSCPFHSEIVIILTELLINDNKEQNEKIELLSKRTVEEKLLYFLKQRANKKNIFKVTTSYKAIADYLFVDRANLMRELKKMEKKELIKKENKTIIIKKNY